MHGKMLCAVKEKRKCPEWVSLMTTHPVTEIIHPPVPAADISKNMLLQFRGEKFLWGPTNELIKITFHCFRRRDEEDEAEIINGKIIYFY